MSKFIHTLTFATLVSIFLTAPAFADTESESAGANFKVTVEKISALEIKVPSEIVLSLTHTKDNSAFGSADVNIIVSTTNEAGYTLTMTPSSTELFRTEEINGVIPTIKNLTFGSYTEENFINNSWGYKVTSSNIDDIITTSYIPVPTTKELNRTSEAAMRDKTTLTFASKVGAETPAGSYKTTLHFVAIANPILTYIQDFMKSDCVALASTSDYTVYDRRDGNDYTVRYINGNCWMTQNLRVAGIVPSEGSNFSNVESWDVHVNDLTAGNTFTEARSHYSDDDLTGVWYNYCAVSAGAPGGCTNEAEYDGSGDICPAGWRLPKADEADTIANNEQYWWDFKSGHYGAYDASGPIQSGRSLWWTGSTTNYGNTCRVNVNAQYYGTGNYGLGCWCDWGKASGMNARCIRK